jgi:hypothetical protein
MVKRVRVMLAASVVLLAFLAAAAPALAIHRPSRVIIISMDQMRPEYAKQFDMTNVLWLQSKGVTFPNAYVGDMPSTTVMSHNVMVSGQFPKHMGWSGEAIRDIDNILGYGTDAIVTTGDLGTADFTKLIDNMDYLKIGDYLHAKYPDKKVACVGIKSYQVESQAASSADLWVRMGSSKAYDPAVPELPGKWRGPSGNVPSYIAGDTRYRISAGNPWDTYGTTTAWPSWEAPEDGRYAPGTIAGHESGDAWVADATMAIMEHEDWSGIFINFPAIDHAGHMWGGGEVDTIANYHWDPASSENTIHMPWVAKNADNQVGRLIAKLKELDQLDDTLIVVTGDHGSLHADHFYGVNALNGANAGWYAGSWYPGYGSDSHVPNTSPGPPSLKPLMDTGNVAFSMQCTDIDTWLINRSGPEKRKAAAVMATLPGVIATYVRYGDRYQLYSSTSATMTPSERIWWMAHGQELVNTMDSADLVGLLADDTGYGAYGDHSGAQAASQRIPMVWYMPGIKHTVSNRQIRLVDILPTMLEAMNIKGVEPLDGTAYDLKLPK